MISILILYKTLGVRNCLPVPGCEPQSDDAARAGSDNEVKETLDADFVMELYLELPQDLQLDYASYTAPAAG
jgi:hypothetical protein